MIELETTKLGGGHNAPPYCSIFKIAHTENGDMGHFNLFGVILTNLENQLHCTSEFVPKALKQLFFLF